MPFWIKEYHAEDQPAGTELQAPALVTVEKEPGTVSNTAARARLVVDPMTGDARRFTRKRDAERFIAHNYVPGDQLTPRTVGRLSFAFAAVHVSTFTPEPAPVMAERVAAYDVEARKLRL